MQGKTDPTLTQDESARPLIGTITELQHWELGSGPAEEQWLLLISEPSV